MSRAAGPATRSRDGSAVTLAISADALGKLVQRHSVPSVGGGFPGPQPLHEAGIGEHGQGLFETFEVVRADEHRGRTPVARHDHPFMLALDPVDELGQVCLDTGQRQHFAHD